MRPATLAPADLLKQTQELHTRRSGPGGQNRNKTQTAVVLAHKPTGIAAEASERRSQAESRQLSLQRLRLKLALEHRTQALLRPSELWRSRARGQQLVISTRHEDYPALTAEALDQLRTQSFDMPRAAEGLGVTATQLARLFRKDPAA
jgi:protein subunit release factor B